MKLTCPVVEDLLPFYHDQTCSQESQRLIEAHLVECQHCRNVLSEYQEIIIPYPPSNKVEKTLCSIEKTARKKRNHLLFNVGISSVFVGALILFLWCVQIMVYFPISSSHFEIRDLCQLSDGQIYFRIYAENTADLNKLYFEQDEEENAIYFQFMRQMIQDQDQSGGWISPEEHQNGMIQVVSPEEYSAMYVGPVGKGKLVWREGQTLPSATEEIETRVIEYYNYYGVQY